MQPPLATFASQNERFYHEEIIVNILWIISKFDGPSLWMAGLKIHETRRILAQNVRHLREAKDMTQEQLANAAGLAQADVSKIEAAKHSTGVDVLQRVARALGTTPAALLEEKI